MSEQKIICEVCGKEMKLKSQNEIELNEIKTEETSSDRAVSTSSTSLSISREYLLNQARPSKEIKIVTYICSNRECKHTKQIKL